MAYVFADEGDAQGTVVARFFFPSGPAILEDPATGSACANLGGWFCALRPHDDVSRARLAGRRGASPVDALPFGEGGRRRAWAATSIELARGSLNL